MLRVFRYRLYPTRAQEQALGETMRLLRALYNGALQERRDAYRLEGRTIGAYEQMRSLKEVRALCPEYAAIHTHLLQDVITRLDRAYQAFFRRCKAGETPGFPRFKGFGRYRTFTFKDAKNRNGARLVAGGKRLELTGIGKVKVKFHRPLEGRVKQVSVSLDGDGHGYVAFVCDEVVAKTLDKTGRSVGIDVGIATFAALSDGGMVDNPRLREAAQPAIRRAARTVARRRRGSKRRRKVAVVLQKQRARVQRKRQQFHHETAKAIVKAYDAIAVEELNVRGLAAGMLAKQVHDTGWAQFVTILSHKAESAGRELHRVEARGTSQQCSACGATVRKGLHVRVHRCPGCGYTEDRDINAARNILSKAGAQPSARGSVVGSFPDPRSPLLGRF